MRALHRSNAWQPVVGALVALAWFTLAFGTGVPMAAIWIMAGGPKSDSREAFVARCPGARSRSPRFFMSPAGC